MFRSQNSVLRRCIAHVAMVGVLFQVFLAIFHTTSLASGQDSGLRLFSKFVVICTGDGLKRISVSNSLHKETDSSAHLDLPDCSICHIFSNSNSPYTNTDQGKLSLSVLNTEWPEGDAVALNSQVLARKGRGPPEYTQVHL